MNFSFESLHFHLQRNGLISFGGFFHRWPFPALSRFFTSRKGASVKLDFVFLDQLQSSKSIY